MKCPVPKVIDVGKLPKGKSQVCLQQTVILSKNQDPNFEDICLREDKEKSNGANF